MMAAIPSVLPASDVGLGPDVPCDKDFLDLLAKADRQIFVDGALSWGGGRIRTKVFLDANHHAEIVERARRKFQNLDPLIAKSAEYVSRIMSDSSPGWCGPATENKSPHEIAQLLRVRSVWLRLENRDEVIFCDESGGEDGPLCGYIIRVQWNERGEGFIDLEH